MIINDCPICHQHEGTEAACTLLGEEIKICAECAELGGFESNGHVLIVADEDAYFERHAMFNPVEDED